MAKPSELSRRSTTPSGRSAWSLRPSPRTSHAFAPSRFEQTGHPTGALEQAELAIEIARRQRLLYEEEQALRVLAELLTARGEDERAREALGKADRLAERLAALS